MPLDSVQYEVEITGCSDVCPVNISVWESLSPFLNGSGLSQCVWVGGSCSLQVMVILDVSIVPFILIEHGSTCGTMSCRPATHPDLIGISRFFSTNLGVSRFPDSTCENPEFLFRFEIGKTKGRLTLLHGP